MAHPEARITAFLHWLALERRRHFDDYDDLWQWSVDDPEGFWGALWDWFDIESPVAPVVGAAESVDDESSPHAAAVSRNAVRAAMELNLFMDQSSVSPED